jgi:hypothetical protein
MLAAQEREAGYACNAAAGKRSRQEQQVGDGGGRSRQRKQYCSMQQVLHAAK